MFEWTSIVQPMHYIVELDAPLTVRRERGVLVQGDENANAFVLEIYQRKGVAASLAGCSVSLHFVRPDNMAVPPIKATINGNVATATLTETCYRVSGMYGALVTLTKDGTERTILKSIGDMISTENGGTVDEEGVFPTPEELLQTLQVLETAIQNANTATSGANTATSKANTAATGANTAAANATTAANAANTAANAANTAAENADKAAKRANDAAASYEGLGANLDTFSEPTQFGASYASTPQEFHAALPAGSVFVGIAGSFTDAGWNFPNKTATLEVLKYNGVRSRYLLHLKSGASYWSEIEDTVGYPTCVWHQFYDEKSTVQIINGGTGATEAPKACENLGAVKKSGDTMTGTLKVPELRIQQGTNEYSSINFYAKDGARAGSATMNATDGTRRFIFMQYHNDQDGADTQYYTQYQLPKATAGLTGNVYYELITQKGGAFVGDLSITKETPQLFLRDEEGVLGVVQGLKNASNTNVSLRFAAKGKGTIFYEHFSLPYANNDLTANKYYNLLTSKSPVTIGQGGTGATTAAAARTALGLDRVTLWSGTAAAGTTVTLKESIDDFSRLAVVISNANSEVLSWSSGKTVAMFSRTALATDDTEGFATYLARIEISSTDRTSATVVSTRYVTHRSSGHGVQTTLGSISAIYGWR